MLQYKRIPLIDFVRVPWKNGFGGIGSCFLSRKVLEVIEKKIKPEARGSMALTVSVFEFIRRFLLHVLPENFVKIRYYGFLSHRNKSQSVKLIRKLIDPDANLPEKMEETFIDIDAAADRARPFVLP